MENQYYSIDVNIKTSGGYAPLCSFKVGSVAKNAQNIFVCLVGSPVHFDEIFPFELNLVCHNKKTRTLLATQYCTLSELKENCHYISREVFKLLNLIDDPT